MIDKLLITQDDIKIYRPTAELDDGRITPFIIEAQECDLKPVLNNAMYYDFLTKFDSQSDPDYTKYNDLLIGKAWTFNANTEYFNGVRPMLCYFALARFVTANPINITRMGVVVKLSQQSQPAEPGQIKTVVNELRSAAIGYQNDVIRFLENNPTTYTLYSTGGSSENAATRTSFNFFKA